MVQLSPQERLPGENRGPWFVAWAGAPSAGASVDVPVALAEGLGLPEGLLVSVRAKPQAVVAASVSVEPVDEDDWEVASLNAEAIEGSLLTQLGAVAVGQAFPFWPDETRPLRLRCTAVEPAGAKVCRIAPDTELVVAPRVRARPEEANGKAAAAAAADGAAAAGAAKEGEGLGPAKEKEKAPKRPPAKTTVLRVQAAGGTVFAPLPGVSGAALAPTPTSSRTSSRRLGASSA